MATVRAHLRRVATGEVRVDKYTTEFPARNALFFWTEGNGSCDCYRRDAFTDAAGEPREVSFEKCGDTEFELVKLTWGDEVVFP